MCLFTERGAYEFFFPVLEQINCSLQNVTWTVFATKDVLEHAVDVYPDLPRNEIKLKCINDNFLDSEEIRSSGVAGFISSASSKKIEYLFAQYALQNNIPIIHIIDTFYGYKRRFTTKLGKVFYQNVALIDETSRKEAIAEGLNGDLLFVTGHPGWERLKKSGVVSNVNRNTVFFGAPIRKDYGSTLGFDEDDAWRVVTDVQRNTVGVIENLVYCPHPKQTELPDLLGFPSVNYKSDMLQDFGQALGIFSAPLIHSFIAGGFSVSVQPGFRKVDWCAFSRRHIIMKAQTCDELTKLLFEKQVRPNSALLKILHRSAERFKSQIFREMHLR